MKELVTDIAKALVDIPDEVTVREVAGEQATVLELRVAPTRFGKGDRETGPDRAVDPDLVGSGGNEIKPAVYTGNSGINLTDPCWK